MLTRLLPEQAGNDYHGARAAIWLLALIVTVKGMMGFNAIVIGRYVASVADGVPLDRYGAEAANAVVALFAAWGLGQVVLVAVSAVVLIRYRTLVPLVYLVLLAEHAARRLLFLVHPIARSEANSGGSALAINLALLVLLVAGLSLSLVRRKSA